jgi:hypothetical protein
MNPTHAVISVEDLTVSNDRIGQPGIEAIGVEREFSGFLF